MRIITERKLREFWQQNRSAESSMKQWIKVVEAADWQNFSDLRQTFNHADVHNRLTIFDVGGNNFRIIAKVEYAKHIVFIKAVLTHKQYETHKNWCDCGGGRRK